jgi:hypothetical protein
MTTRAELIELVRCKIANLNALRTSAQALGDVQRVADLDTEITETQITLDELTAQQG